jgi:hypothetical protein
MSLGSCGSSFGEIFRKPLRRHIEQNSSHTAADVHTDAAWTNSTLGRNH